MIIDLILDRYDAELFQDKHGEPRRYMNGYTGEILEDVFNPDAFAAAVMRYEREGDDRAITAALISRNESSVKAALCEYIMPEYNPNICGFIFSVNWLTADRAKDCYGKPLPIPAI